MDNSLHMKKLSMMILPDTNSYHKFNELLTSDSPKEIPALISMDTTQQQLTAKLGTSPLDMYAIYVLCLRTISKQ